MKPIRILALAALVAAPVFSAATADDKHPIDPRHGGLVSKASHLEIELVAKTSVVQVYLRDHDKPLKADGGSAKLTLLGKSGKTEAPLPAAGDRFEATGVFNVAAGTKAVVVINRPGKPPLTARFILK